MTVKVFRRGSARCFGLLSAFVTILLCLYYISLGQPSSPSPVSSGLVAPTSKTNTAVLHHNKIEHSRSVNTCSVLETAETDISTVAEFSKFEFQPDWIKSREFWDKNFEERYEQQLKQSDRPPLKVIIVPHSHNDPGWLKTFVNYFESDSKTILNLIVSKLQEYKDMTFIWSEISILQLWWDQAHPSKQRALKELVHSGRLEITTGGWVMTDEANVHVYAMVDQLIEGHQWLKNNLNFTPRVGWSIDPFGHGSTVPYLLSESDFEGTIIQRIHYVWKQWFARHQAGDFLWKPYWTDKANHQILTHNMPFDIYSIKHSCGPHPFICLNFDFRKIPGEYTEFSIKAQFITEENVEAKATLLMEQYSRTASLFKHNVALIPLGDDFRYNQAKEVQQQYTNYKKLIDYINAHPEKFNSAQVGFGTPVDYFREIRRREENFPSLKGDFFVYSDIFTDGRPAYWSGYFTTRPTYKILSRDLEHNLRALEILFTVAFNKARQSSANNALRIFEKNYEKLIEARRNLGLFQHHDAITGTSKSLVMRDYGLRLFDSIQDCVKLQQSVIEMLMQKETSAPESEDSPMHNNFVLHELEREVFNKIPRKMATNATKEKFSEFIVYNSLAQERYELVLVRTTNPHVKVFDPENNEMTIQINPVWNISTALIPDTITYTNPNLNDQSIRISQTEFEIMFVAKLKPLSLNTFRIEIDEEAAKRNRMATIYCNDCKSKENSVFEVKIVQPGDIQLENGKMRLLFDEKTGFLKTVTKKNMGKPIQCAIKFGAYRSSQYNSGAYLFKPDSEHESDPEKDVLEQYQEDIKILITSGPLASDVTVIYGPFMAHTVRILNSKSPLDDAIYIENDIDFEPPPKNRETEMFMRIITDIENGDPPEFYSDASGFQYQFRVKVNAVGIEGNYYPITAGAFIQDPNRRLTLLTNHAQGAASLEPGQLEVMIDRRTLYDDYRGMGEGIVDSRMTRHKFWMLLESFDVETNLERNKDDYQVLSYFANQLSNSLNYPANIYFIESTETVNELLEKNLMLKSVSLLNTDSFPCDTHIMTLRTMTEQNLPLFPSRNALLVLHKQGYDCQLKNDQCNCPTGSYSDTPRQMFNDLKLEEIVSTSLTGSSIKEKLNTVFDAEIHPMEIKSFKIKFSK